MPDKVTGTELRSTITAAGQLRLEIVDVLVDPPGPEDIIVRMEAAPINPSDLGLLLGPADLSTMLAGGTATRPVLTAQVPASAMPAMKARLDQSMPVGNEGAGTVVQAGSSVAGLLGRKVATFSGGMYTQYRRVAAKDCMPLPEGTSAADGAGMFVNPLTALAFTETMRAEGHSAIVHCAAASNLGQMLNRICLADGIPLVNIVRSSQQEDILHAIGAPCIVNSSEEGFDERLADAIAATGATIGFDPIGGGELAGKVLHAMEVASSRNAQSYSRYGSTTLKQVYIYGGLDSRPTSIVRNFGYAWSLGGWLLMPNLQKLGAEVEQRIRDRIVRELQTTFKSHYSNIINLADTLKPEIIAAFHRKATGDKYLIDPSMAL